jgi:hypothetical protein
MAEMGKSINPAEDEGMRHPFAALVVCVTLMASSQALMDLEFCAPMAFSAALIELDAAQGRLAFGPHAMRPWFRQDMLRHDVRQYSPALLTFHICPLLRFLRPNQLLALAGRGIPEWNVKAREQVSGNVLPC